MTQPLAPSADLRELSVDELDAVSGGFFKELIETVKKILNGDIVCTDKSCVDLSGPITTNGK